MFYGIGWKTNTQNTSPVAHNEKPERRLKINTQEIERVDRFMSEDNKANGLLLSCKKERNELDGTGQQQQLRPPENGKHRAICDGRWWLSVSLPAHKHMLCSTMIPFVSNDE